MLGGLIGGVVTAFVIDFFGFSSAALSLIQPFVKTPLNTSHLYLILGAIGVIGGAFRR